MDAKTKADFSIISQKSATIAPLSQKDIRAAIKFGRAFFLENSRFVFATNT